MKKRLQFLLFFCLPLLLASCEKGIFDPEPNAKCLELSQQDDAGWVIERVYDGRKVTEIRYFQNEELRYYYEFTYGSDGRVVKSQYVDTRNNTAYTPEIITYNEQGKWARSTFNNANGTVTEISVEYDSQSQIQKITSATTKDGTTTVNYTAIYTWENGNNVRRTYTSPTQQQVVQYAFDLDQHNKRRKEQEKYAFMSLAVAHNENMLRHVSSTTTTGATTVQSETEYSYTYNDEGYPTTLTRYITSGANPAYTATTYFSYDCD
ncbi:hypothetical protein [Pontibacter akesuensis]|uniref:YD repeat-containing protein n=1 Tax=Pontibacter akesuensis TaxID=388950 RepID=A0A1I7I6S0_9BACT|nr:hypothetical protein [Pontibacter akesuensis]GHA65489.1 hypothetical protein GCM10007389_17940 [Pontibacter akesuensis]SFU68620.1 hypothetical protein SAMN04487941_1962 [Pontibacter akesuensis]